MKTSQTPEQLETQLREELERLLKKCRVNGKIPGRFAYLCTEKGKRILEIVFSELKLEWKEANKLLDRADRNIQRAMSFHGIKKTQTRKHETPNMVR